MNAPPKVTFASDSPLEGTGFEPLVPRKAPGVALVCRVAFAPTFPFAGDQAEATLALSNL
jgi:hypothetical protein